MKFFKQKAYTSSVSLSNHSNKPLTLHIEPWGSQLIMPHGSTFQIVAVAQVQGESKYTIKKTIYSCGLGKVRS